MPVDITGTESFSNGAIEKPVDKDRGNTVFSILEAFMDRLANHKHTGADSHEISLNISKDFEVFNSGIEIVWLLQADGIYRATFAVPVAATFDTTIREFRTDKSGDWSTFFPTVERINDSSYYLYVNDNTLNVQVVTL